MFKIVHARGSQDWGRLLALSCDGEISNARLQGYTGVLALFA